MTETRPRPKVYGQGGSHTKKACLVDEWDLEHRIKSAIISLARDVGVNEAHAVTVKVMQKLLSELEQEIASCQQ